VHDPALLTADSLRYYRRVWSSAARARALITVSEHTRSELLRHTALDPDRVRVIHNAITPEFAASADAAADAGTLARLGLASRPYFLFVGTIEPRKNLATLIDAFAALPPDPEAPCLVLAGADGWHSEAVYAAAEGREVRFLGYVPSSDLPALYRGAVALAHPALDEGFGMTLAEAMAAGTPVVASDGGSLPEVAAGAALHVPATDVRAWTAALAAVRSDRALAAGLVEKGRARASHFSLERMALQTLEVYREAAP
jgi:glycosyltransferase involved in cell wall biosynthesis